MDVRMFEKLFFIYNTFFFFTGSYLECMYTQNPAASIDTRKSSYISLSSRFGYYFYIIIFQYSDFFIFFLQEGRQQLEDHFPYSHDQVNRSIVVCSIEFFVWFWMREFCLNIFS